MWDRILWMLQASIDFPEKVRVQGEKSPGSGSGGYKPRRRDAIVDLPLPDGPTIAVQEPGVISRETLSRVLTCGLDGYVKERLLNLMGKGVARRLVPCDSWDWLSGRLARCSTWVAVVRDELSCGIIANIPMALMLVIKRILMTVRTVVTVALPDSMVTAP